MAKAKTPKDTIKVIPAPNALVPVSKVTNEQKDQYTMQSAKYQFEKIIWDFLQSQQRLARGLWGERSNPVVNNTYSRNTINQRIKSLMVDLIARSPRLFLYDLNGIRPGYRAKNEIGESIFDTRSSSADMFSVQFGVDHSKINVQISFKIPIDACKFKVSIEKVLSTVGFLKVGTKWVYNNENCSVQPVKPVHPKQQRKIVKYVTIVKKPAVVQSVVKPLNMEYIKGTVAMLGANIDAMERERQGLIEQLEKVDRAISSRKDEIRDLYQQVQDWQKQVFGQY